MPIAEAAGSTALDGQRGLRGQTLADAMEAATVAYLREIEEHNTGLEPADFVDECGQLTTGFVDPKRYKVVDHDELLKRKIAARAAAKKALSGEA